MLKKLIATLTSVAMLTVSLVPAVMAEEPSGYDYVIYTNDFESAQTGSNLSQDKINFRPENCTYAVVQDGDNKYYTFSPNNASKRSNSGNLEQGYFLPATAAQTPVTKLKVEMDVAVDLKGNGPASVSTYFRGTDSGGHLNSRWSIVEFDGAEYYTVNSPENRVAYTAGEWVHLTMYLDYENNLCSVYSDGGLCAEGIKLADAKGVDKVTQIRFTMQTGESNDSSMKIDNLVYSTTKDVFDAIGGTVGGDDGEGDDNDDDESGEVITPPVFGDEKPEDYQRVIFSENFDGDVSVDTTSFEWKPAEGISAVVDSDDSATVSAKDQGDYANLTLSNSTSDNYFRMFYGSGNAPIQRTGLAIEDLNLMQISLDVCTKQKKNINIRFFDKWTTGSTKADNLIVLGDDGNIKFLNSDITIPYNINEWMSFDVYVDLNSHTYNVYINGNAAVINASTANLGSCVESVGYQIGSSKTATSYTLYMDNVRFAIPQTADAIVVDKINNSSDVQQTEAIFEEYKNVLNLDSSLYCFNTYLVVSEQVPYGSVEQVVNMANKASNLLDELNSSSADSYTSLFTANKDIMLHGAEKLDIYSGYAKSKKAAVNNIIVNSSPFSDFAALREAFDNAVSEYIDETGDDGSVKDYNVVLYNNDFENVPEGIGLTAGEMNYLPENCDYEIVSENGNKYYTFSPNSDSKRSNSGNTENGYLDSVSVAVSPIRQVKVDIDVAVDLKDEKAAGLATYYRGKNLIGTTGVRTSIIEFSSDEFYSVRNDSIRAPYVPGEWIHFTLYLDYLSNLVTIYANGELFAENIAIFPDSNSDRFNQIRLIMDPGSSMESSIKIDNVVYSTTEDEYDSFRYTNLYPELTDPKPYDYNRVLYFEDFEGDTSIDGVALESKYTKFNSLLSDMGTSESAKNQGAFASVDVKNHDSDNYFRVRYGAVDAPVQKNDVSIADLSAMQFSFDICPVSSNKTYNIRFLEKFTNPDSAKGDTLMVLDGGKITFMNSTVTKSFVYNEWMSFDVFFDFTKKTYSVYLNGNAVVKNTALSNLVSCVESVGVTFSAPKAEESYCIYMDNFRIAIPYKLSVASVIPEKGSSDINIFDDVVVTFTNPLKNFVSSYISVKEDDKDIKFDATAKNESVYITFPDGLDFDTNYTLTLSGNIADVYGNILGEDMSGSAVTMKSCITSSVPVIGSSVTATVVNPTSAETRATLVASVVSADGSSKLYTQEKTVPAGKKVNFDLPYEAEKGQKVMAFVAESADSLVPIRNVFATSEGNLTSESRSVVTSKVDSLVLVGDTVNIEGSISSKESRIVIIKLENSNGDTIMAVPVETDKNGKLTYSYYTKDLLEGEYKVSICGYNVTNAAALSYVLLSDAKKLSIRNDINKAKSASEIKSVLASYKSDMKLADSLYCDNTYNTLFEQAPYLTYDEMIEMIYTADSILKEINNADWSRYSELFNLYEDIILADADKTDDYSKYSSNKKNAINKILVDKAPFASFVSLREHFDNAVEDYSDSSSGSSGGGGGGGGGGKSSGGVSSYNVGTMETLNPQAVQSQPAQVLFADMVSADWAKAHVNTLYNMGIVSAASNYRPLDSITREEFVKMLVQLAGLEVSGTPEFSDVSGNEWFAPYLAAAQKAGIVKGDDAGAFGVGANITRQDMVVMAQRTVTVMGKSLKHTVTATQFADSADISDYAAEAVANMQTAGVVSGMGNGNFMPFGLANRAQAAVVVCNLINAVN